MLFDGGAISTTYSWTVLINNCSTTRVGSVVTSADEITEQIRRLLILKMNFFFGKSPNEVEQYCNLQHSIGSDISAIDILPDFFIDKPIDLSERIRDLDPWIEKVLSLDRQTYKSLCKALAAYEKALQVLASDPTLSYSLLIFVLEALANSDDDEPTWQDLPVDTQNKFDVLLNDDRFSAVDTSGKRDIRDLILNILKPGASKRFTEFTIKHIPVNFYNSQNTTSKSPIRYSKIRSSIQNAYSLRSSFAHALVPLTQYLICESNIAEEVEEDVKKDVKEYVKTYLTLRGLFRLVRSVLLEFIERQEPNNLISHDWNNEFGTNIIKGHVPAHIRMRNSQGKLHDIKPQYALKILKDILNIYQDNYVEHLHLFPGNGFMGFGVSGIIRNTAIDRFDPSPSYDWKIWRDQSLRLIPSAEKKFKGHLQAIAILCAHLEEIDGGNSTINEVIQSRKFGTACLDFENFVVSVICNRTQQWTGEKSEKLLEKHLKNRKILLPTRVEIACMIEVARLFQQISMTEGRKKWLAYAYKDAARYPDFQIVVKSALESDDIIVETQAILYVPQYPSLVDSYTALISEDYW